MFFGLGRKPLLDFLRNLTPQILMLTVALVAGSKLNFNKFDLSIYGVMRTLPFAACLFVFVAALCANFSTLIEDTLEAYTKGMQPSRSKKKGFAGVMEMWMDVWKNHKLVLFNVVLMSFVAEIAIVVVTFIALQGALSSPFLAK